MGFGSCSLVCLDGSLVFVLSAWRSRSLSLLDFLAGAFVACFFFKVWLVDT